MARAYIPALSFDFLTPLYDPLMKWGMRETRFKIPLVEQARIEPGQRVLDLGCGTATLTILAKRMQPGASVAGLDADQKALDIARRKSEREDAPVTLHRAMADQLPYPDNSFDRVLTCLMLHHLKADGKRRVMREVLRVLRPGGEFHVADIGRPHNALARLIALSQRSAEMSDNIKGLLPAMLGEAGFGRVEKCADYTTLGGTLALYKAVKP